MVPVYPYQIRRSDAGNGGELLLSLQDRKSAMVLHLSMEQARTLAVEMRGLATDHCVLHHLVLAVTRSLGAEISGALIKGVDADQVTGAVRLEREGRLFDVTVDVAAALAVAFHLGLPIFLESMRLLGPNPLESIPDAAASPASVAIPEAFREVIEALDLPAPTAGDDGDRRELNG